MAYVFSAEGVEMMGLRTKNGYVVLVNFKALCKTGI